MATVAHTDSKPKYSWWWNSHIPKNSKWLQENLTDMDVKVKQMIKLIEEDADSFARRAEMYYKKRPELMKLVEEFYRAYRALAERYDHATGALRQAHRTMAEAFPNQVPFVLGDDSPAGSVTEADPQTPDMGPVQALFDPDELQIDAVGLSPSHLHALKRNGVFTDESDSVTSRRGVKQFKDLFGSGEAVNHAKFGEGRARKGLSFHDAEEKERAQNNGSHDLKARVPSESERVSKAEMEISTLKNALAKLEAEKEAGLLQYQQSLEQLNNLELEVSRAREDSKGLSEQANKAETEVQTLKLALRQLEAEREAILLQYQQCLDKISTLEKNISRAETTAGELGERACKTEIEAQSLKQDLSRIEAEKEDALVKYEECLKTISDLEAKLKHSEEDARRINENADKAESEVESLKQALAKITEEKEALALQYQQCLETISNLEHKLACAQEEARRLTSELDDGFAKLKGAEEKCLLLETSNQTLHSELESMVQKMGSQSQELTEKQTELGRLWTCIQEEHLRFVEAETAFQTLQHLHSQSQEELRSLAAELQNRSHILKDMETRNQCLQDEVEKVKEENKGLNEVNLSSAVSIKSLQDEIMSLRETIGKLESEVELRVDQRNALQQEIYCLKEELNELNKKHQAMMEQVESVCLNPDSFSLSVKELQDENSKLKEVSERDKSEKLVLLEKLEIMEKLLEKNALLENSLSDLNAELEGVREKVKALEEACRNLLREKSTLVAEKDTLISELQMANQNLEELSKKNSVFENSLFDANAELEGLRVKSKSLEDSCLLLDKEKSGLITERESLVSQLDIARKGLDELENRYAELRESYMGLEKERESTLRKVEDLQISLDSEKEEHASFVQLSETRLVGMDSQIRYLQEEGLCRKKEYEEELDKAVHAQIEIFILQKCVQDLEEKNFSLLLEHQKLLESSDLSKKHVCDLENENFDLREETRSLSDQIKTLRVGVYQVLKTPEIEADRGCETKLEQDHGLLNDILTKLKLMRNSLSKTLEENQQLVIENSVLATLLCQLKLEAENVATEKNALQEEFTIQFEKFVFLQSEARKLVEINEELRTKAVERDRKEEVLKAEMENLHRLLLELQGAHRSLQEQNCKVLNDKKSLMKKLLDLGEDKRILEEENGTIFAEMVSQSTLSLILKDIISEKSVEISNELEEKIRAMEGKVEDGQTENSNLKKLLEKSENELILSKLVTDELNCEIENGKNLLSQKGNELLVAEQLLSTMQNERAQLHKHLEDLMKKLLDLGEDKRILEEENGTIFAEMVSQSTLSLILKDIISEKSVEISNELEEKVRAMEGKVEDGQTENSSLKKLLEKSENELILSRLVTDELNCEIENGKNLLSQKGNELLVAEQLLSTMQNERAQSHKHLEDLMKKLLDLGEDKRILEEENGTIFAEMVSQSTLSLILMDIISEKSVEISNELEEKIRAMEGKVEDGQTENSNLKKLLEKSENELILSRLVTDELNCEIENGKNLLSQKGNELLAAKQLLSTMQNERAQSHKHLEDLMKKLLDLGEDKRILEEENGNIFAEMVSQSTLSLILMDIISEKSGEISNELEEKIRAMEGKVEDGQTENSNLKKLLEKSENELILSRLVTDELNCEIENGKNLLSQKGNELLVAEQLLSTMQNERAQLHKHLEDLNCKYDEIKMIREDQEKHIQKLSEDNDCQIKETGRIHEENLKLESELRKLCGELEETKCREEGLNLDLEKAKNEVKLWEAQAAEFFCELQISSVFEALLEEKTCVLTEACKNLEDGSNSKDMEIGQLKERVSTLASANGGLKAQLATAIPAVVSLTDYIRSLENHTVFHKTHSTEVNDAGLESDLHAERPERCQKTSEDQIATLPDGFPDLQDLQMRIKAVEKAVIEKERLAMQEKLDADSKLEAVMRQVVELKCGNTLRQGSGRRSKHVSSRKHELGGDGLTSEIAKGNEVMTKDIMLDQVSECSSYGISRRGTIEADDQMLGLWESNDCHEIKAVKQHKSKNPSIESLVEKELGVDKLQLSKRFSESEKVVSKKKTLERLDSDAQKLSNLQIAVEDLKRKLESSEKSIKGKVIECNTVKEQLEEAEEAIVKLLDDNRKLITNSEDGSSSRIPEQARRISEKIGRLQLEVQKIQFLLQKLDDDKESSRGRTRIPERKTSVLLRDYLSGGMRTKKKKARFCACIQPPTKGD